MATLLFAVIVCAAFVGLTRLTLALPFPLMDAVIAGLGFFVLPGLLISPPSGALWATCLFGVWSMGDSARLRRLRLARAAVPDRVPEEWRTG
jgi:hypothetical protein